MWLGQTVPCVYGIDVATRPRLQWQIPQLYRTVNIIKTIIDKIGRIGICINSSLYPYNIPYMYFIVIDMFIYVMFIYVGTSIFISYMKQRQVFYSKKAFRSGTDV